MVETMKKSSPMAIGFAWAIVVLPTLWGLNYTVQNAMKIFAKPVAAVSAPAGDFAAPARSERAL